MESVPLSSGFNRVLVVGGVALLLAVSILEFARPYLYLAPDSFTYFTMARQFHDTGLLFSYSGVDHTTGIHPGYYFLMLLVYPLFGLALPAWSFLVNGLLIAAGIFLLARAVGALPAALVLLAAMTPFGAGLIDNGMESSLLFFFVSFFAAFLLRSGSAGGVENLSGSSTSRLLVLGLLLGGVVFSRLDAIFLAASFYMVGAVSVFLHAGFSFRSLGRICRSFFFVSIPLTAALALIFFLDLHYGGSLLPVSGALKSSFPAVSTEWLGNLLRLKTFGLSVVLVGTYLLYRYARGRPLGLVFPSLFLASASLYIYNGLFVSDIGAWYGALPFFSAALAGALWLSAGLERLSGTVKRSIPALFLFACVLVLGNNLALSGADWISPHEAAAAFLASHSKEGETAGELKDGVFAFYASIPVYNLTGLGNNGDYIAALRSGTVAGYFADRRIAYVVSGSFGSGVQVPGSRIDFSGCAHPIYDTGLVAIFRAESCILAKENP